MQAPLLPLKTSVKFRRKEIVYQYCSLIEREYIYSQSHSLKFKMPCNIYIYIYFNSSLVTIKLIAVPLLPLPVWFYALDPKDLAFYIPGIPTSVPPRLLIIAACSLHNHFTAREDRGSPSGGMKMRHV